MEDGRCVCVCGRMLKGVVVQDIAAFAGLCGGCLANLLWLARNDTARY